MANALTALLVHGIVPLILSVVVLIATIDRIYAFNVNDLDYGLFNNIVWNFANGNGWLASHYVGEVRSNFLADHMALYIPLLALPMKLFPSNYTLGIAYALSFSLSYFLVPVLVREIWRAAGRKDYLWPALFLLLALAFYKGYNGSWRFMLHMTTFSTPFVLCAMIALHRGALGWAVVWCVVLGMAQERSAVAVFGVGMYAALVTGHVRFGGAACALSAAYFFAVVKLFIPSFYGSGGGYLYTGNIAPFHALGKKAVYLVNLCLYWFFQPVMGRKALLATLCAGPIVALGLVSNRMDMFSHAMHYQDLPSMFLVAAAAHGLLWLTARKRFLLTPKTLIVVAAIACLAFSAKYARHTLPLQAVLRMKTIPEVEQQHQDLRKYTAGIPEDVFVYASNSIGPALSLRKHRYRVYEPRAREAFNNSLVFVGRVGSPYPYTTAQDLIDILDANDSLKMVVDTGVLRVYASKDIHFNQAD